MTTVPDYDLQAGLNDRLNDELGSMAIAWENDGYSPTLGTPFLRATLLPGESRAVTLGENPYVERVGIFQVDCIYPIEDGFGDAKTKAAAIVAAFPANSAFIYNGLEIKIDASWPGPGQPFGNGWYAVPVSIKYRCYYRG